MGWSIVSPGAIACHPRSEAVAALHTYATPITGSAGTPLWTPLPAVAGGGGATLPGQCKWRVAGRLQPGSWRRAPVS